MTPPPAGAAAPPIGSRRGGVANAVVAIGPTLLLAGLALLMAIGCDALARRPLALAIMGAAVLGIAGMLALARVAGAAITWVCLALLAIVAGEMGSLPLAGQSGRILWADGVIGLGLVVALARGRLAFDVPRAPFLDALWPFLAWCALTALPSVDPLTAAAEYKEWVMAAVLGVAAASAARDARRATLLLAAVSATATVVAALMIGVALTSPLGAPMAIMLKVVDLPWGRTNYLAGLLILAIPILLGMLGDAVPRALRVASGFALPVVAAGLIASASKGAIVAVVGAVAIAFGLPRRQARAPRWLLIGVLVAAVAVYAAGPLRNVTAMRLQESAIDYSASERMDLYRLAWTEFARHPLLGLGLNDFSVAAHRFHGVDTVPHNLELGFLAELGLPGFMLALAWIVSLFAGPWLAFRHARTRGERSLALGLWAALLGFAIHNQFESTLYGQQYKMMLFVVAGAAWGLGRAWQRRAGELVRATSHAPA